MGDAKNLVVQPIDAPRAIEFVRRVHYSGTTTSNAQLHLGVFWAGRLEGVMQFGPSIDKRRIMGLVEGTTFNGFLELARLAFTDVLPRNSESRALGVALRMIRARRPDIEWVVSFADATQCGDGAIYRASGFVLTGIKRNHQILQGPTGRRITRRTITDRGYVLRAQGSVGVKQWHDAGWKPLPGFQLRYMFFLNPAARARLRVPVLPFSRIDELGARMYKGHARAGSIAGDATVLQADQGGSTPTPALHTPEPERGL